MANGIRGYVRARGGRLEAVIKVPGQPKMTRALNLNLGQEEEARHRLDQAIHEVRTALDKPRRRGSLSTFEDFAERWLQGRFAREVVSARDEAARLRHHAYPVLGPRPLAELTKAEMLAWVRGLTKRVSAKDGHQLSPRYLKSVADTVRQLMGEAVDLDLIPENPCAWRARRDLPKLRDQDARRRLTGGLEPWEVWALVHDERIPEDRRVLYALLAYTGQRPNDIFPRRFNDFVEGPPWEPLPMLQVFTAWKRQIRREGPTKTGIEKVAPVHPELLRILRTWRSGGFTRFAGRLPRPDDLIVPADRGGVRSVSYVNTLFKQDLAELELRGGRTLYALRGTFRSAAEAGGAARDAIRRITHPGRDGMLDLYERTNVAWPALCKVIEALTYGPRDVPDPRADPRASETEPRESPESPVASVAKVRDCPRIAAHSNPVSRAILEAGTARGFSPVVPASSFADRSIVSK